MRQTPSHVLVIVFAAIACLTVVGFTWLTEYALAGFFRVEKVYWWMPLLWTSLSTAGIVWLTLRFAPRASGSGIPQVMAALEPVVDEKSRSIFVSLKLSVAKIALSAWGLLAGGHAPRQTVDSQTCAYIRP